MKISIEGLNKVLKGGKSSQRSYTNHCPNVQLSPQHVLNFPVIQASLFKISPEDPDDLIFSDETVEVAEAVFGAI
ncbi:hypothetical protein TNCV_958401 [Trichonephila clavipes]|nr:hypothetical protein TNCV_958401 [Trichonephila clavipes]